MKPLYGQKPINRQVLGPRRTHYYSDDVHNVKPTPDELLLYQ